MEPIKHTEAFDLAWKFVTETHQNVFLTGKAGTGKTTFLKYLRSNCPKNIVVAAPTGVAAINAGGVTLHSLFQLPFGPFIPSTGAGGDAGRLLSKIRLHKEKLRLLRNMEILVIDEASMVACYTVDAIDTILRSVRRNSAPFGGVQLLFIGDLHQLPPVVKRDEWEMLRAYYSSVFFFDSLVLRRHIPVMIELQEIFRQKDGNFIDLLNGIRNNSLRPEDLQLLNARLDVNFLQKKESDEGYIILTTHNQQADQVNATRLKRLNTKSVFFEASVYGDFPEKAYPADAELELRIGAQVMFLKNDVEGQRYFNGKIGVVSDMDDDLIYVKCEGDSEDIEVKKSIWKNSSYKVNPASGEVTETELGTFSQFPLRLAWAITIHKSQGLTFEKLVVDAENAFASGQVYVALSRCRSLEGLVLTSPVNREFLGASRDLSEWKEKHQQPELLPERFRESRVQYITREIRSMFDWASWKYLMSRLRVEILEAGDKLPAASQEWVNTHIQRQQTLLDVAHKFDLQLDAIFSAEEDPEKNSLLQERLKSAAAYFVPQLQEWLDSFLNHPLQIDTRRESKILDGTMNDIALLVWSLLHRLQSCSAGFSLQQYLKEGKRVPEMDLQIRSSYGGGESTTVSTDTEHGVLYGRIARLRKELSEGSDAPLFRIFSNKTIVGICDNLPGNEAALLRVKGLGKVKVKVFGEEILQLVNEYCEERGLKPQLASRKEASKGNAEKKPRKSQGDSMAETVRIFRECGDIEKTAQLRGMAVSTMEGHLAMGVASGIIDINEVIRQEELNEILSLLPDEFENKTLNELKKSLPDHITYGKLRMVLASKVGEGA